MTETMVIEEMTADYARLQGFHTTTRVPYLKYDSTQPADIDVMGIDMDNNLLAAECKAHGAPDAYYNWNTNDRIDRIQSIVDDYTNKLETILDAEFSREFENGVDIETVWIIFKGHFAEDDSSRYSVVKSSKDDFETELSRQYNVQVELIPIHDLIRKLIDKVAEDMLNRRKRYASPTLELIRLIAAIAYNQPSELDNIITQVESIQN